MDNEDLELTISAEDICRTCLAAVDRTQLKPIFCNEILDGRIVPFPSVLELAIGEKLVKHDKLPNNVCSECKGKLRELYLFIGTVRKSSKLLHEIFTIKPSNPVNAAKNDTKHAESQTERMEESCNHIPAAAALPRDVKMNDAGMQCCNETADAACQTDEQLPPKNLHVPDTTGKIIKIDYGTITPTVSEEDEEASSQVNEFLRESPMECTLVHLDDQDDDVGEENNYEMVLLPNESNEEDCFTLRPVKTECKKQLIVDTVPCSEAKRAKQSGPLPETSINCEQTKERRHLKKNQAYCSYCNWTGRLAFREQHFLVHKATFELCLESVDYFRCSDCFTVFSSQTHFIKHVCTGGSIAPSVRYHPDLQRHETFYLNGLDVCVPRLKSFKKMGNKYQCGRCIKFTANGFAAMRQHCLTHEAEDDKTDDVNLLWTSNLLDRQHACGVCGAQFPDATYIRQHLYFHQESFVCIYDCGVTYASFLQMTRHFQRKHMQGSNAAESIAGEDKAQEQYYHCTLCSKAFSSAESLKNHLKIHYRSRKYVCTECNKCFSQKSDLNNHSRIHTDDRPYACKLCDKKFRTNSHLRDHAFTHEEVNKFECNVCHKMFKAKRILAGHVRLHTGDKPYQCNICSKSFTRKQHLVSHRLIHFKPGSSGTPAKQQLKK